MTKRLFTDTEASIHLGITKELLYAYVRYSAKKALNDKRKLISKEVNGKNMFDINELNSFDAYLKEPWSNDGDKRPEIPSYIQDYLKTEIEGKCPITNKGFPLENAHIDDYSISRSHHHHNIIRIAKDEHTKFDTGVLSKESLKQTKNQLVESLRQRLKIENGDFKVSFDSPKPHKLFTGRDIELIELIESMKSERLVVIVGIGGVGKTQLLLNAIDNVIYHNPLIWIDIETVNTFDDLILLISNEISKIEGISIAKTLMETLSSVSVSIVLDGLENLLIPYRDEVEDFIHLLMIRTDNIQLLITTQIDLSILDHEKAVIKLDGISDTSSKVVLNSLLSDKIEIGKKHLEWILWFCGGHPLSLKLVSSLINFYKSIDSALGHLKKSDALKQPLRSKHNKSNALSICLNTVYTILTTDQIKILSFSKFFPVGVKYDWAKSMLNLSEFESDLAILQQFFLTEVKKDILNLKRIIVQNPLRTFLYDRSKEESLEVHFEYEKEIFLGISIEVMLVDHKYIETSSEGSAEYGILRIESELPNIMEVVHNCKTRLNEKANKPQEKWHEKYRLIIGNISSALGKYFFVRGFYEQGIKMAKEGITISMELKMYESVAIQYIYLFQLQSRQYDLSGLKQTVSEMEKLLDITDNNYVIMANHWLKGRLSVVKQDCEKALNYLKQVEKIIKERISQHREEIDYLSPPNIIDKVKLNEIGNLGMVYSEIAGIYENKNEIKKALKYYEKGLEIQLELNDEVNSLSAYYHVANCYIELEQREKALKNYFICVDGFLRHRNDEYLANTLAELGRNIEFDSGIAQNELLSESTFITVFENLNYRLKNIAKLNNQKDNTKLVEAKSIPFGVIGQMILLVQLTAFSKHREYLHHWAMERNDEIEIETNEISFYSAIINLAHAIGLFDYWKKHSEEEQKSPINTIFKSCLIINGGPDIKSKTRIFFWLAEWFKYVELDKEATAMTLWNKAWNSFKN